MVAIFLVVIRNINTDNNHTYAIWLHFYSFNFRSIHLNFLHAIFQLIQCEKAADTFFWFVCMCMLHFIWYINQSICLTGDEIKRTQNTQTNLVCNEILFIWAHEIFSIQWLTQPRVNKIHDGFFYGCIKLSA